MASSTVGYEHRFTHLLGHPPSPERLEADRQVIAQRLEQLLGAVPPKGPVHRAMCYAVRGEAKRVRPLLALRVARMLGAERPLTLRAAAAVELLHCASLIVDDLPCMDNDAIRRNRPATHVAFGEPVALLAAFGLVSVAGRSVLQSMLPSDEGEVTAWEFNRLANFQNEFFKTLDSSGLLEAQARDLEQPYVQNEGKTVPFFRLAVQAGMMFAEFTAAEERVLLNFAEELGRAFQSRDDLVDSCTTVSRADLAAPFDRPRQALRALPGDRRHLEKLLAHLE